jgi:Tfp pilus assembly protein PilN
MLKTIRLAGLGALLLVLLVGAPALAQDDADLRKEIDALKAGQQNIQRQLAEIKKLLQQRQAPPKRKGPVVKDVVFDISNGQVKGDAGAKLTLIEFTDYQ